MGMKILKILLKVLSAGVILFLLYLTAVFGRLTLGEGKHLIDPYIDTEFAPDYSPKKFNKIKIGMTVDEVESIIGKPFYKHPDYCDTTNIDYVYTNDGKLWGKMKEEKRRYYEECFWIVTDFAWYRSYVIVDTNNNIVVEINKGWSYD